MISVSFASPMYRTESAFAGALNGRWALPGHQELIYGPSCNLGVRAEVLAQVRFDERFPAAAGEDYDFCHRLRRFGTIAPSAQGETHTPHPLQSCSSIRTICRVTVVLIGLILSLCLVIALFGTS